MSETSGVMPVVCLKGGKGHGKTTAAQALIERGFIHINFADPLKEACRAIFGLTWEEMEDSELKEKKLDRWPFLSPREIMQHVGTELFRAWLPETWTRAWAQRVADADRLGARGVVCSDMRFPNEYVVGQPFDALVIEVFNPRVPPDETANHVSEQLRDEIPHHAVVTNDSDVSTLRHHLLDRVISFGKLVA
jgi:hypothetical protein